MHRPHDSVELARALANPLRRQLFLAYRQGVTSPSRAARALGAPVNLVSYHTRVLHDLGYVELDRVERVRGAVERFYRAVVEPAIEDDEWAGLPVRLRRDLTLGTLSIIWSELRRAAVAGGFDGPLTHLSRTPLELDAPAIEELNAILRTVMDDASRLQAESAQRAGPELQPVELVMLHFERASAP